VTHLIEHHQSWALVLLFLLIAVESAGVPLPGETALVASGVLASQSKLNIVAVIAVASAAAIIGDNGGYWLGRKGGRKLLERWSLVNRHAQKVLPRGERLFARHGGKTVFFGRFIAILRITAAWMAGISRMHWLTFLAWNAAGGICWAVLVGLLAYYCFTWLVGGAAIFFLLRALGGDPSIVDIPYLGGVAAVGAIVAFLSLITPSGLGVREASMYGLLLAVSTKGVALGVTVLNRLTITAVEAALLLAGAIVWRYLPRPQPPDP